MKAKFLWASLLLFAGITACTDDAIESQTGNGSRGEGTPAYLSISFSANAGSSTKAAGDNTGDQDGSAEDSGHANAGTADEVAVKTALIVVVPTDAQSGGTGFAKLYSATASAGNGALDDDQDNVNEDAAVTVINETTKTYSTDTPIEVTATDAGIEYKVLVVVNPVESLTTYTGIASGINDLAQAQQLYNAITTGDYTSGTPDATYITAASELGSKDKGFMMANRAECVKTVTTANTVENPAKFDLDVERVLSKITFRPNMDNNAPSYIYKVESTIGAAFKAETKEGAYDTKFGGEGSPVYGKGTFNKGHDVAGNEVWILYDNDSKFIGVFAENGTVSEDGTYKGQPLFVKLTPKTQEEYTTGTDEDKKGWYVGTKAGASFTEEDEINSVTLEMKEDASASTTKTFYVKLEGYALTNLSKSVNYVLHILNTL